MASNKTAALILLCATLFTTPVFAESESIDPSQPPAASEELGTQTSPDLKLADVEGDDTVDRFNFKYVKSSIADAGKVATSPLRWEKKEWVTLGVVLGGTAALFLVDEPVKNVNDKAQFSVGSKLADFGNTIGHPLNAFPALGAFYLYGHLTDNSKARRTSLLAFESFAISGVMMTAVKSLAKRHRPNTNHGADEWDGPDWDSNNVSFASGHTSSAFALATVFAEEYKDKKYVPAIAYGLAGFVALSRVYSNEHWTSDTFFGAALGYFTSKAVLSYHKQEQKTANRLTVLPEVNNQMTGLRLRYDF